MQKENNWNECGRLLQKQFDPRGWDDYQQEP